MHQEKSLEFNYPEIGPEALPGRKHISVRKPIDNCEDKMTDTLDESQAANPQLIARLKRDGILSYAYHFRSPRGVGFSACELKAIARHLISEYSEWQRKQEDLGSLAQIKADLVVLAQIRQIAFTQMEDGLTMWFPPSPAGTAYGAAELMAIADYLDKVNAPWEIVSASGPGTLPEPIEDIKA